MGTTVSVALCTFNGARWIEEQLRSILGQSLLPDEIVVSDDRSTDATLTVLTGVFDSWTAEHPDSSIRLLVMSSDVRRGVTANFERSILATTGDLIALCDQDDVWHPDRLQQIVTTFAGRRRLLLLHGDARIVDEAGIWSGATLFETLEVTSAERSAVSGGRGYDALLRRNLVTGATTVLRRELVARSVPFPADWVHDEWLGIIGAASGEIDFVSEPLLDYRQHSANQIGARRLDFRRKLRRLTASRRDRNERLVRRARALVERLASGAVRGVSQARLAHELFRQALSVARGARFIPILQRFVRGDYGRYSRGFVDAIRDLVQAP